VKADILFITNGHGEDRVARNIIGEVKRFSPELTIMAHPLVGKGHTLEETAIPILGPRSEMPSGGFIHHNLGGLISDIFRGGLFRNLLAHRRVLSGLRGTVSLTVAIGDMIPVFAASLVGAPLIHVGINKSDYYRYLGYTYAWFEIGYLKANAVRVFTRDAITAERLSRRGVRAEYVGNPMMDGMPYEKQTIRKENDPITIGFLPGTRRNDIQKNIEDFAEIARTLQETSGFGEDTRFLLAHPSNGALLSHRVAFESATFENVLARSQVIVGLSGTGNEQAAGCGKPVVAFPGRGEQYSKRYGCAQEQLLGEALTLVERNPEKIAKKIEAILTKPFLYQTMARTGRERMGNPGASAKIAEAIIHERK